MQISSISDHFMQISSISDGNIASDLQIYWKNHYSIGGNKLEKEEISCFFLTPI